jgi:hypothetical protein
MKNTVVLLGHAGLSDIDAELEQLSMDNQRPVNVAPPAVRAPSPSIPDYVEHCEGATEIGKLSAEAVVREYEAAAKEIEGWAQS